MDTEEINVGRKFIEPKLLARIEGQEEKDGVDLSTKHKGDRVTFETVNTIYEIEKVEERLWLLTGGKRWSGDNARTKVIIVGSTFGGSIIKVDWLGEGMNVEVYEPSKGKTVVTSPVVNLWEYPLIET